MKKKIQKREVTLRWLKKEDKEYKEFVKQFKSNKKEQTINQDYDPFDFMLKFGWDVFIDMDELDGEEMFETLTKMFDLRKSHHSYFLIEFYDFIMIKINKNNH